MKIIADRSECVDGSPWVEHELFVHMLCLEVGGKGVAYVFKV